jgi:hypothetical protein
MKPTLKPGLSHRLACTVARNQTASNTFSRSREFAAKAGRIAQAA